MKQYTIKITGRGTFEEISEALLAVAEEVEYKRKTTGEPIFDIRWEEPTLMTEITED